MQNRLQEWPDDEDEDLSYISEGWDRLIEEAECVKTHWASAITKDVVSDHEGVQAEIYQIASHLRNMRNGFLILEQKIVTRYAGLEVVTQMVQDQIEEATGKVVEWADISGDNFTGFAISLRDPADVVPDDASELDDGE